MVCPDLVILVSCGTHEANSVINYTGGYSDGTRCVRHMDTKSWILWPDLDCCVLARGGSSPCEEEGDIKRGDNGGV